MLFELCDLLRAKCDVGTISNIIMEAIRLHKLAHCHNHETNESIALGDAHIHIDGDDVEHGYYDEHEDLTLNMRRLLEILVSWKIFEITWPEENNGFFIGDPPIT